tara:strand:- start:995 stop:1192 length:198 start_codon:yes stop_codon:yes gene_type:complete
MNQLSNDILNKILIPKYLDKKYHNYSLLFKIDIFVLNQKIKKVVYEINLFYNYYIIKMKKINSNW